MTERINQIWNQAAEIGRQREDPNLGSWQREVEFMNKFAELIQKDMHRKVIASILITDVIMEEKGQKPTSEDYIRAINKDFGVEE